ncbi:hypothetical protein CYK00_11045 [Neisseria sicca]|uniref:Uncharacterized protein n=1 Tax=Neisseria sicca TaxID=490 RepID=A0A2I1X9Q2_NEISI|nr:hypothetical protein CYK00_11045 [Neisseria sicca]
MGIIDQFGKNWNIYVIECNRCLLLKRIILKKQKRSSENRVSDDLLYFIGMIDSFFYWAFA